MNIPSVWHTKEGAERTEHIGRLTLQDNDRMRGTNGTAESRRRPYTKIKKRQAKAKKSARSKLQYREITTFPHTNRAIKERYTCIRTT